MVLLERESSLASLAEYAREASDGDGRLALVAGEAGVGKSALVEALQDVLPGARWSWGACDGLFVPRPLAPLFDLGTQLGGELAELCRARAPREELFDALLREIGTPGNLDVVVIEDVHWADEATIDLLRFLGRRIRTQNALLIATYRDDGMSATDPLRLALGELATQRSTRRVGLAPLSAEAVKVLAGDSGIEATELYRLTGGNPFYVTEVVRAGTGGVPASARDAVLARAARLEPGTRELLDVAALVGAKVELDLLEAVTACTAAQVDEVLRSGLLSGDGDRLRFRHEIGRLAVEQAVAAHRRAAVHCRILAGLRDSACDDDARLAFHAEAAGDAAAVLEFAPAAGRVAAELGSHREAAAQYRRTLRFVDESDPARVAALYQALGDEAALIDLWEESADARRKALAFWHAAGDPLREGDMHRMLSRSMWRLCRGAESAAAAETAVRVLEPLGHTPELAWAYACLVGNYSEHQPEVALEMARRARALGEELGVPQIVCHALDTEACISARIGRPDWAPLLHRALDIALAEGFQEEAGRAYANMHAALCARRRYAEAEPYYVKGLDYCDNHDISTYGTCLRGERTRTLIRNGKWSEAESFTTTVLRYRIASTINRLNPTFSHATVLAHRGDSAAWTLLDRAVADADGTWEAEWIVEVRLLRAEVHWLEGGLDEARAEAELAADVAGRCDDWERGAVATWLRRTGSTRTVEGALAEPYRLQIEGDWRRAAQAWSDLGCRYEEAFALVDADEDEPLRRALDLFQQFGSTAGTRVVRQRMRDLGMRSIPTGPQAATRDHPLGLTRRERQVLDLICDGRTNAEIAAKLFISAKTVDHHVSAVLAKLDAPNRGAAASEAVRLGLVSADK